MPNTFFNKHIVLIVMLILQTIKMFLKQQYNIESN